MLHKKFGIYCLIETRSNNYACAKLSKCTTNVSVGEKCCYFYLCMFMFRIGSGKILRLRKNPRSLCRIYSCYIYIYDLKLQKFIVPDIYSEKL